MKISSEILEVFTPMKELSQREISMYYNKLDISIAEFRRCKCEFNDKIYEINDMWTNVKELKK